MKTQGSIVKYFEPQKVTVFMISEQFRQFIINIIVKSGIPLTYFSFEEFLTLNGEMARKLGVSLDRLDVRDM